MILGKSKNDLSVRDRLSRLEGQMSVVLLISGSTFVAVLGLVLAQAFG